MKVIRVTLRVFLCQLILKSGEPPHGDDDLDGDAAKSDSAVKESVMAGPKTKSRIKGKSGGKMTPEAT